MLWQNWLLRGCNSVFAQLTYDKYWLHSVFLATAIRHSTRDRWRFKIVIVPTDRDFSSLKYIAKVSWQCLLPPGSRNDNTDYCFNFTVFGCISNDCGAVI